VREKIKPQSSREKKKGSVALKKKDRSGGGRKSSKTEVKGQERKTSSGESEKHGEEGSAYEVVLDGRGEGPLARKRHKA